MNKDQVKGAVKEVTGKAQKELGELTGSNKQRAKGLVKEVEGKTQRKLGDVEEALTDAQRKA